VKLNNYEYQSILTNQADMIIFITIFCPFLVVESGQYGMDIGVVRYHWTVVGWLAAVD